VRFSFLRKVPAELGFLRYCRFCYDDKVSPQIDRYNEVMKLAKSAYVFFKTQKKAIPIVRRSKETFKVNDCPDRNETILRLAFYSAELGFNAIVDAEVICEKVRNAGYQTSNWRGTASPAQVDAARLERDFED